ncbi:MAG: hypothetical protein HRT53_20950 [Colwellia sp.]|nr:hypothetical protein [Colwellia sp.]
MSYQYVDGRGGIREGAGRPKLDEVKKAFRVTENEKDLIKQIRLLSEEGSLLLDKEISKLVDKYSANKWW